MSSEESFYLITEKRWVEFRSIIQRQCVTVALGKTVLPRISTQSRHQHLDLQKHGVLLCASDAFKSEFRLLTKDILRCRSEKYTYTVIEGTGRSNHLCGTD